MILEGRLYFEVDTEELCVGPGEVLAIPSNVPHTAFTRNEPAKAVDAWSPLRADFVYNDSRQSINSKDIPLFCKGQQIKKKGKIKLYLYEGLHIVVSSALLNKKIRIRSKIKRHFPWQRSSP